MSHSLVSRVCRARVTPRPHISSYVTPMHLGSRDRPRTRQVSTRWRQVQAKPTNECSATQSAAGRTGLLRCVWSERYAGGKGGRARALRGPNVAPSLLVTVRHAMGVCVGVSLSHSARQQGARRVRPRCGRTRHAAASCCLQYAGSPRPRRSKGTRELRGRRPASARGIG